MFGVYSSKQDIANQIMISNIIRILENESLQVGYSKEELLMLAKTVREELVNNATIINDEKKSHYTL